jgi:DNA-binding transcriptional regulator GbsR (MarR family)
MSDAPSLEQEFVDFLSGLFSGFGLDSLSSRLVSIIFLEPEEVSMEDLAEKTGYSLASLSNKLRLLESQQMVKRVRKPGTKKSFYFIEKDVYAIMRRKVQAMEDLFITPAKNYIPGMIEKYKNAKLDAGEKQKMDIIRKYHKQLLEVDQCMQKMKKELESKAR